MLESLNAFLIILLIIAPGYVAARSAFKITPKGTKTDFENTFDAVVFGLMCPVIFFLLINCLCWVRGGDLAIYQDDVMNFIHNPALAGIGFLVRYPWLSSAVLLVYVFVMPLLLGHVYGKMFAGWDGAVKLGRFSYQFTVLTPFPNAWVEKFYTSGPMILVVEMKTGKKVCGLYGYKSRASGNAGEADLYLEQEFELDKNGRIVGVIPESDGFWVDREEVEVIHFLPVPVDSERKG